MKINYARHRATPMLVKSMMGDLKKFLEDDEFKPFLSGSGMVSRCGFRQLVNHKTKHSHRNLLTMHQLLSSSEDSNFEEMGEMMNRKLMMRVFVSREFRFQYTTSRPVKLVEKFNIKR